MTPTSFQQEKSKTFNSGASRRLQSCRQCRGGLFVPKDGQLNPVDTINALIAGAKKRWRRNVCEGTPVDNMRRLSSGEYRLDTARGTVVCETLVLACGLWTRDLAAQLGARVPLYACEHMYVVTEAMDFVVPTLPVLRDPDGYTYMKEDAGKLLIGSFEPRGKPLPLRNCPPSNSSSKFRKTGTTSHCPIPRPWR